MPLPALAIEQHILLYYHFNVCTLYVYLYSTSTPYMFVTRHTPTTLMLFSLSLQAAVGDNHSSLSDWPLWAASSPEGEGEISLRWPRYDHSQNKKGLPRQQVGPIIIGCGHWALIYIMLCVGLKAFPVPFYLQMDAIEDHFQHSL